MQLNVNRLGLCFVGGRWPVPRPHSCIREWDNQEEEEDIDPLHLRGTKGVLESKA